MKITLILASLLFVMNAFASKIAIIDSGTDYLHEQIINYQWINPVDLDNGDDEDKNGYKNDIYGWNFAENNNLVIDYKYLGTFSMDCYIYFEIQLKGMLGTITEEEKEWIKAKKEDQAFRKELNVFGNFVHGTHVTGISVNNSKNNIALAIKLLPTSVNEFHMSGFPVVTKATNYLKTLVFGFVGETFLKFVLSQAAKMQIAQLKVIAEYVNGHKMEVANGSFGVGLDQAKEVVKMLYKKFVWGEPTEEKIDKLARNFINDIIKNGKDFVGAAPNTLFVFAAGNDGTNNDEIPSSPTNIKTDNVISVAATISRHKIAPFSNYGIKMVDVAAPGVGILSAIPSVNHNEYLAVSGTSQAAPYVTNVAGEVKEINPKLTPKEVKEVIMGTVDYKDFLKGVVMAGGIVNPDRAKRAANLSLNLDLKTAIKNSRTDVRDIEDDTFKSVGDEMLEFITPMPFPSMFQY